MKIKALMLTSLLLISLSLKAQNRGPNQDDRRGGFPAEGEGGEFPSTLDEINPADGAEGIVNADEFGEPAAENFEDAPVDEAISPPRPNFNPSPARQGRGSRDFPSSARGTRDKNAPGGESNSVSTASAKRGEDFAPLNPETGFGPEIVPNFDFPNADIMDVANAIQKLTGVNFITDTEVKGKISITSPSPITVGDAWRAFASALALRGYTIVPSGKYYKIVRERLAKESPVKIYTGKYTPDIDAYITRVIPLKFISSEELTRNFRMFISRDARITSIEQTNTLIITDTGANIKRLLSMIKMLDVPGHEEVLEVIPVKEATAKEIADLLEKILSSQGSGGSAGSSASRARRRSSRFSGSSSGEIKTKDGGVISQIIADERTNSLVVLANVVGLRKIRSLVQKLDRSVITNKTGRIHVYYLQHGNAEEIAKTLQSISQTSGRPSAQTNQRGRTPRQAQAEVAQFEGGIKITADKQNNSLVITASQSDYKTLKEVLSKLDIPRDQVYVEAVIMELSMKNVETFSVNITGKGVGVGSVHNPGFVSLLSGQDISGFLSNLNGFFSFLPSKSTVEVDINGNKYNIPKAAAFIQALETATKANVLSRPQIMTLDNEKAIIKVTDKVPYTEATTNNGVSVPNTKFQDVGLTLEIKPSINRMSDMIKLEINQEFSTFAQELSSSSGSGVRTSNRIAETKVVVRNGNTIAIGGLMRDNESSAESKVPILGDIPLLGWLFKGKTKSFDKTNLILFLTPRIIKNEIGARNILEEKLGQRQEYLEKNLGGDDPYRKEIEDLILSLPEPVESENTLNSGTIGDEEN